MATQEKKRGGLKQAVYRDLRDKLINCVYAPGTTINELELTQTYGVSRTPVREAVTQLEMDGYVKILPKKGIYVTEITLEDVMQIFRARAEIEPITLRMAKPYLSVERLIALRNSILEHEHDIYNAYKWDMQMHLYFIDNCRNNYLVNMMHKVFDDNTRVVIGTGQNEAKIHNAVIEHTGILDSLIAENDIEVACRLMRKHIENCRLAAIQYLDSPAYREHIQKTSLTAPAAALA